MSTDKIQPALASEMARLRSSGALDARVPVIVSITGIDGGRLRDVASLEAATRPDSAPPHAAHRAAIHPHSTPHRAPARVAHSAREGHPIPPGTRCPATPATLP